MAASRTTTCRRIRRTGWTGTLWIAASGSRLGQRRRGRRRLREPTGQAFEPVGEAALEPDPPAEREQHAVERIGVLHLRREPHARLAEATRKRPAHAPPPAVAE